MRTLTDKEKQYLKEGNIIKYKILPSGEIIGLMTLMYTFALLSNIGTNNREEFFKHRYCYPHAEIELALRALDEWEGVGKPLKGYTAYKGTDMVIAKADEERKANAIKMENQDVV
jgi:hypothetical protein